MTNGVAGKRRKIPKTAVPESAYGAGQHKTKVTNTKKNYGMGPIVKSFVDHSKTPPAKRSSSWKAKGDAELVKWANSIGRETSSPRRRRRDI